MALTDAFAVLDCCIVLMTCASLKTHLLEVEVVATLTSRALRKFIPAVASLRASLIGLVHGKALLTVLLVWRVFEVVSTKRQNHLISLSCALRNTS